MKKYLSYLKNKFILASSIFLVYTLFLDENDIFTIFIQKNKLSELVEKKAMYEVMLDETTQTLKKLKYTSEVERFAREHKLFKKDDEDIFVIFQE
ncbi:MAG: hypothetical protein A3D92_00340 [Bacteroidetes bacterium RIFCSPHIGHO2_02_FULL_44_7]|nr:MAG: hypothetical protein A3D92_00340 [Bacteroidetes bacterium RIFCSPHIGHO2_02_FULL_44_7]